MRIWRKRAARLFTSPGATIQAGSPLTGQAADAGDEGGHAVGEELGANGALCVKVGVGQHEEIGRGDDGGDLAGGNVFQAGMHAGFEAATRDALREGAQSSQGLPQIRNCASGEVVVDLRKGVNKRFDALVVPDDAKKRMTRACAAIPNRARAPRRG